jgi:hypothetical protein
MRIAVALGGLCVLSGLAAAGPALAIAEVDLADLEAPVEEANLETDDASNANPGDDSQFTTWVENGASVTPLPGHEAFFNFSNGALGMRFRQLPAGFGDGTAVIVFDEAQRSLAIEGNFSQQFMRVQLFEDAAGSTLIDTIVLGDPELGNPGRPIFAVRSPVLFRRAQVQDVNASGMLLNSNAISDLRFTAVPEPSPPLLVALAAAGALWLRRGR